MPCGHVGLPSTARVPSELVCSHKRNFVTNDWNDNLHCKYLVQNLPTDRSNSWDPKVGRSDQLKLNDGSSQSNWLLPHLLVCPMLSVSYYI